MTKYRSISNIFKSLASKTWFRKRFADQTNPIYQKSLNDLKLELQVENVFFKFDEDGSNSLDC